MATNLCNTGVPTGRLATWWVIASEIVIFGGLLGGYLLLRLHNAHWGEYAAHTQTAAGALNTFVLLTSSLSVVLAHHAAENGQKDKAFRYIWFTIGGGLIFMCVKTFEYTTKFSHDIFPWTNVFWGFYFTATGLHGLHVLAGARRIYRYLLALCRRSVDLSFPAPLHRQVTSTFNFGTSHG
jgi:heme/copper-type cytochrome/quinol oxidase subunit 3